MRSIVTFITAAAFVLHFALGCCAHRAQAGEAMVCVNHALGTHSHDGNGHEAPGSSGQSPVDSGSQCPGPHCNDCHCVFMAFGKTLTAKAAFTAVLPLSLEEISSPELTSSLAAAAIDSGGQTRLPVRIHLFHQVLMI